MALDDQEWWKGQNYLGRPSSLRLTGESPGDQSGGAGVLDAGAPPGGGVPAPTGTSGAAPQSTVMPGGTQLSPTLRALLAGAGILEKGATYAQPLLASSPGAFGGIQTPSGQFTSSAPEVLRELQFPGGGLAGLTPSDYGLAAGAEFGDVAAAAGSAAGEAGAELAGEVSGSWGGPIFAAMKAFIDLVGEGKIPGQDIINLIAPGTIGASEAWQSFRGRLGNTLGTEAEKSNALAQALLTAQGPQGVQDAIAQWRAGVGEAIPGFGSAETDPYALTFLPGAGGTKGGAAEGSPSHEGFNVDFGPTLGGLEAEIQAALHGLSPQERIAAFQSGAQPLLDARTARDSERRRAAEEQQRLFDESAIYNVGSA